MTHGYGDMVADSSSAGDEPDDWQTHSRSQQPRRPHRDEDNEWGSPGYEWSGGGFPEPSPQVGATESRWQALEQTVLDHDARMDRPRPPAGERSEPPRQLPRRPQRGAIPPGAGTSPAPSRQVSPDGSLPDSLSRRRDPRGPSTSGLLPRYTDDESGFPPRPAVAPEDLLSPSDFESPGDFPADVASPSVMPGRYVPRGSGQTGQVPRYTEDDPLTRPEPFSRRQGGEGRPTHTGEIPRWAEPGGRPTRTGEFPRYADDERRSHTGQIPRWSEPEVRPGHTGQFPRYIEPDGRLSHTGQIPRHTEPEGRTAALPSRGLPHAREHDVDELRPRRGRFVIFAAVLLVLLVAGGVIAALASRNGNTVTAPPVATGSPADDAKIASQKVDPKPLTTAEVFGSTTVAASSAEGAYHVVKSQIDPKCANAATGKVSALLTTLDCSQVVRATLTSADGSYIVTAGIFNLPDAAAANAARTSLKPLVDAAEGRLNGFDAGGATTVITQAPTHVGWDSRGHYLMYVVVALADGDAIPTTDNHPAQIIADVMENYLGDTVITAREAPAGSAH